MAARASFKEAISAKPKPLERPLYFSLTMVTVSTCPNCCRAESRIGQKPFHNIRCGMHYLRLIPLFVIRALFISVVRKEFGIIIKDLNRAITWQTIEFDHARGYPGGQLADGEKSVGPQAFDQDKDAVRD